MCERERVLSLLLVFGLVALNAIMNKKAAVRQEQSSCRRNKYSLTVPLLQHLISSKQPPFLTV